MVEFIYTAATSFPEVIPSNGNSTMGSNAVAASGKASDIHQVTINIAMADMFCVLSLGNTGSHKTMKNRMGPSTRPMLDGDNTCLDLGLGVDVGIQLNLHC